MCTPVSAAHCWDVMCAYCLIRKQSRACILFVCGSLLAHASMVGPSECRTLLGCVTCTLCLSGQGTPSLFLSLIFFLKEQSSVRVFARTSSVLPSSVSAIFVSSGTF